MGGRGGVGMLDELAGLAGKPLAWRAVLRDAEIDAGAHLDRAAGGKGCLQGLLPEPLPSRVSAHPVP